MSACIKEIIDYKLIENCTSNKSISLEINFHKDRKKKDGLYSHCKSCRKQKKRISDEKSVKKKHICEN